MTASGWSLRTGATIGRYRIVRRLARGGMGEVYLARMEVAGAGKLVALKRMAPVLMDDPALRQMFLREARLALQLDHPGIVGILDIVDEDDEHAIVMEYVHGHSVRELLAEGPLPIDAAIAIAMATARALHHVHECRDAEGKPRGLVHRDVSPENVMVRYDGEVQLIDFGIARVESQTILTEPGALKGKLGYMSPEQLRQDPLDRRSDIFQLGVLLFELTTGKRPFEAHNVPALMNCVLSGEVPSPRDVDPRYPEGLAAIVMRALALEPEDRPATAQALHDELEAFATDLHCNAAAVAREMNARFEVVPVPSTDAVDVTRAAAITVKARPRRRITAVGGGIAVALAVTAGILGARQSAAMNEARTESALLAHAETRTRLHVAGLVMAIIGVGLFTWRRRGDR